MRDLPGKAIHDYYFLKTKKKLFVHDTFGPKVEMPVSYYFRDFDEMPDLEKKALELCTGTVLDIGAAAGSHALELQRLGFETTALEISETACEVMKARGVKSVVCEDFFQYNTHKYDTLLLLMNGIGLCSSISGFKAFLQHSKNLLNPSGKIIFDSCDIAYMYEEVQIPTAKYYGEATVMYEYQCELTDKFQWLYLDVASLTRIAQQEGWTTDIVFTDDNSQFLAVLTL